MWYPPTTSSGEFVCEGVTFGVGRHRSPNTGIEYEDAFWSLHISRDPMFYLFKGTLPLWALFCFALLQYAYDVKALEARHAFLVALTLTSFAVQWTVTDRLPRTPFLTAFDRSVFTELIVMFLMALGDVVVYRVNKMGGHGDLAQKLDLGCLGLALLSFVVANASIWRNVRHFTREHGRNRTWREGPGNRVHKIMEPQAGACFYLDLHDRADSHSKQRAGLGQARIQPAEYGSSGDAQSRVTRAVIRSVDEQQA